MDRKDAIEVIKKNLPDSSFTRLREALETLIPELKESEDERIRKQLIAVVELYYGITDEQEKKDCLSWLEKKSEQKSVEDIAKEVIKDKESAVKFLKSAGIMDSNGELAKEYRDEQNPIEWSKEDKRVLSEIIEFTQNPQYVRSDILQVWENWLKLLKERVHPQTTWKPSEEQIDALKKVEEIVVMAKESSQENAYLYTVIKSLKEDLYQLKGGSDYEDKD